ATLHLTGDHFFVAEPRPRHCSHGAGIANLSADVRLVKLDFAGEHGWFFGHQLANLVEYAPRGLVGNAKLPFQLLSGDTAARRAHQEHRVEPRGKRSGGLGEDRASKDVDV